MCRSEERERHAGRSLHLCRRVQHIFNEYAISGGGVVDKDVGHGANQRPASGRSKLHLHRRTVEDAGPYIYAAASNKISLSLPKLQYRFS